MLYQNKLFLVLAGLTTVLSITLFVRIYVWPIQIDGFLTIPRTGELSATSPPKDPAAAETPDAVQADANWRAILEYVQKNPEKAGPFLADMKAKFFDPSCGLKQPRIDFVHLADSYQPIFTA